MESRSWDLDPSVSIEPGLGRSAFAARFTGLVGQPVYRYLVARRMDEAAPMLESGDDAIARIATRVGYETTTAFSKAFKQHYTSLPAVTGHAAAQGHSAHRICRAESGVVAPMHR
jgi:AraC-like DNA-binding protein